MNPSSESLFPAFIIFILGLSSSTFFTTYLLLSRRSFLKAVIGRWIVCLLFVIMIGAFGCAVQMAFILFSSMEISLLNQVFLAFRFSCGVMMAMVNVQIALERCWLICYGESVPSLYSVVLEAHAVVTLAAIFACAFSKETHNFRRPGGSWQPTILLVFTLQYLLLTFGGLNFLYLKTYLKVKETLDEGRKSTKSTLEEARMLHFRVVVNCIAITVCFMVCYTVDAVLVVYSLVTPNWTAPPWLDAIANTMVACDTVATPFLAVLLHKDLVSRQGILDSIRKGRMSRSTTPNSTLQRCTGENTSMYISTSKEVEAAAVNSIERSKSIARTSRHFSLGATL